MTSIVDVATHWPRQVLLESRQEALGITDIEARRYRRGFGLDLICWDADESEEESLLAAVEKLSMLKGQEHHVRYIVRARTVRSASPYGVSPLQNVRRALDLEHAQTFTVTDQACASGLLAVNTAGMLLEADGHPDALALVLLGEKAHGAICQIVPRVAVNGEGTAAVLLRAHGSSGRMLGYAALTAPILDSALVMSPETQAQFGAMYPQALRRVVMGALDAAGLAPTDIDVLLPHNVNRMIWAKMAPGLGFPIERVFLDNVPQTGHCFTADPFINYVSALELGRLHPGQRCLMTSVGLGATFAAMVFEP